MSSRTLPRKRSSWYVSSNERLFNERRASFMKKGGSDKKFNAKVKKDHLRISLLGS